MDQKPQFTLSQDETAALAKKVMHRQAGLSIRVASLFIVIVLGLPLFNLFQPTIATKSIGGFPLSWLFLGVLFFPITWLMSYYFVRRSDQLEAETVVEIKSSVGEKLK